MCINFWRGLHACYTMLCISSGWRCLVVRLRPCVKNRTTKRKCQYHLYRQSSTQSSNTSNQTVTECDDKSLPDSSRGINSDILQRLLDLSKPERHLIIASAGTLALTSSITLLLPWACGQVLDTAMLEAATQGDVSM